MILLDTNVLSELMRPEPHAAVARWVASQAVSQLFTSTVTQAEILQGVLRLPSGRRRDALMRAANAMFNEDFADRVLVFDSSAAAHYARLKIARDRSGHPITVFDAQIAAIACAHGATVATRNLSDFEHCGCPLLDPWVRQGH